MIIIIYFFEKIPSDKWLQPYSPFWDAEINCLFYVQRTINRYDMNENRAYPAAIESNLSTTFIIPTKKYRNQYAISDKRSVRVLEWDGIVPVANESNSFNIAKASPKYKFYGGTFSASICASFPSAAHYRYTKCQGV